MPSSRLFAAVASALLCAACASAPPGGAAQGSAAGSRTTAAPAADSAARAGVLAPFVGQPLVIVPVQRIRVVAGAPAWAPQGGEAHDYLLAFEGELAAALTDRGVARGWTLPAQVERTARRNPTFASDPRALSVEPLLPRGQAGGRGAAAGPGTDLRAPLASQLRALTALTEEARYVLVPVELRFEGAPAEGGGNGASGRVVLRLAVVDTRLSRLGWVGDVASDPATSLSPALAASLADRVAGLAAPPR